MASGSHQGTPHHLAVRGHFGNYSNVDDNLNVITVQVSLDLRYSRISWISILYFDFIPSYLLEVAHRAMIEFSLRYSKGR